MSDRETSILKWIGTSLQIPGCLLVALHIDASGWAFPIMLLGSLAWFIVGLVIQDRPLVLLNLVFSGINVLGVYRWLG